MKPTDNEDKKAWCALGEERENEFLIKTFNKGISVFKNPAKKENPYSHDYFMVMPCDIKSITTRFNTSRKYGIDPKFAITLNLKDVERYSKHYPNIIIIFDIDFGDYKATHYTDLFILNKFLVSRDVKIHTYKDRINDKSGNAKQSYVMDCSWFPLLF